MEILLISLLTLVASFVGILAGFGTSTIMVPIMLFFFPLPQTLLFVGIVHFFNDLWGILLFKHGLRLKILLTFGIPGIIASFLGARIVVVESQDILLRILGAFLIAYVALLVFVPKFNFPHTALSGSIGGTLSGFVAGVFGVGGTVRSMFLTAFNLPKEVYIFTSGAIAILVDTTRLFTYYNGGTRLPSNLIFGLLFFIPISFIGAEIAKKLADRIPQNKFRFVVLGFIFLAGAKLLLFP